MIDACMVLVHINDPCFNFLLHFVGSPNNIE
jgi:hypothetical protein